MVWVGRGGNITIIDYTTTACLLSEEEIMYKTLFHCDISTGTIHRETAAWTWGSQMVAWLGGCVLLLLLLELVACNILTGKKLPVLLSHPWWRSSDNVNLLGSLFSRSPSFFTKKPWVANDYHEHQVTFNYNWNTFSKTNSQRFDEQGRSIFI